MDLIKIDSTSSTTNRNIADYILKFLEPLDFKTEVIEYSNPEKKINIVAKRGKGGNGFALHLDTVPPFSKEQLTPYIKDNRVYGRGACDMKGPIACALLAAKNSSKPCTLIFTSDEEIGCIGAKEIASRSQILKDSMPENIIITEPTEMIPIFTHKGLCTIKAVAKGDAKHSSLDTGISSNYLMAPFIYYLYKLKNRCLKSYRYKNKIYTPSTNGFNFVISDNNCPLNITSPGTICNISFRTMENSNSRGLLNKIIKKAKSFGLETEYEFIEPLGGSRELDFVKKAEIITNNKAMSVPYLTDACRFTGMFNQIVLGPGSIKHAHTSMEYIEIDDLVKGYNTYRELL